MAYLSVDQTHDSCFNPHAHSKAGVCVLVVEDRLQAGQEEHKRGIEIALPQWSVLILHKA